MRNRRRVIMGMPQARVGSTFLTGLLNGHPEIRITVETRLYRVRRWPLHFTHALGQVAKYPWVSKERGAAFLRRKFTEVAEAHPRLSLHARSRELSVQCIRKIEGLFGENWGGIVGDKGYFPWPPPSVRRYPSIEEALTVFPDLHVIFLYRHPLDTLTSLAVHTRRAVRDKKAGGGLVEWDSRYKDPGWHVITSDHFYRQSLGWIEAMERWEKIRQSCSSLTLRYEDLRDDPKTLLRQTTDFLGVGPPDRPLRRLRKRGSFVHIGYWKREYPRMVKEVHPGLFDAMERYGYSV